jgi:hypothetical protein
MLKYNPTDLVTIGAQSDCVVKRYMHTLVTIPQLCLNENRLRSHT